MCHPAVIVLRADVSFLPSQEIKGVPVLFQLCSSSQSSLCPFPPVTALAGGIQLCVYREGRVQLPGLDAQTAPGKHLSHPGPAQTEWSCASESGLSLPRPCCSCWSLHRGFTLLSSTSQLIGMRGKYKYNAFRKQHLPICRGAQKQKVL